MLHARARARVCVAGPSLPHARVCACIPELLCHKSTRNTKERDLRRVGRLGTGGHSDESPRVSPPTAVSGVSRTAAQPRSRWLRCCCCPKQRERTLAQRPAARRYVRCRPGSPEERAAPTNATWTSSRRLQSWEERRRLRRRAGVAGSPVFRRRAQRRLAAGPSQAQFFAQARSGRGLDCTCQAAGRAIQRGLQHWRGVDKPLSLNHSAAAALVGSGYTERAKPCESHAPSRTPSSTPGLQPCGRLRRHRTSRHCPVIWTGNGSSGRPRPQGARRCTRNPRGPPPRAR